MRCGSVFASSSKSENPQLTENKSRVPFLHQQEAWRGEREKQLHQASRAEDGEVFEVW